MLERWGTIAGAYNNYICKKCELPQDVVPDYEEKTHEIEAELLSATIDGQQFSPAKVHSFLGKVAVLRRAYRYLPIKVVKEEDLQKYFEMYMEEKKKEGK